MGTDILFTAHNVSRYYGDFGAIRDINMDIGAGEIVGLIGENGAGKSTLLKVVCGVEQPSEGAMTMHGEEYRVANPLQANRRGVGMVFQEQSLIRNLTVAENIHLGRESRFRSAGIINWRRMNQAARESLEAIGIGNIAPDARVWDLNFAARQMVEIAKVFDIVSNHGGGRPSLILLDEPTSVLNEAESEQLFEHVRRLKREGNSIIFVSHRLNEVLELTDRIYVFKDGAGSGEVRTRDADERVLYEMMVGRSTTGQYYKTDRQTVPSDEVALSVRGLSMKGVFRDIDFDLHKGEVLGLCGVEGSGNEAVCAAICGDDSPTSGTISVGGREYREFKTPVQALGKGILSVPKERREEGIIGILSIAENIILSNLGAAAVHGVVSAAKQRALAGKWVETLDIKCSGIDDRLMRLSGGNAQKVVFARAIVSNAAVLILNHPTRGVDVGSKEEIYSLVRDLTEGGTAIILLGDTLDEYIGLASRLIVMKDGLATGEFDCPADAKPAQVDIIRHMM